MTTTSSPSVQAHRIPGLDARRPSWSYRRLGALLLATSFAAACNADGLDHAEIEQWETEQAEAEATERAEFGQSQDALSFIGFLGCTWGPFGSPQAFTFTNNLQGWYSSGVWDEATGSQNPISQSLVAWSGQAALLLGVSASNAAAGLEEPYIELRGPTKGYNWSNWEGLTQLTYSARTNVSGLRLVPYLTTKTCLGTKATGPMQGVCTPAGNNNTITCTHTLPAHVQADSLVRISLRAYLPEYMSVSDGFLFIDNIKGSASR